jgi:hypothetical protein
MATMKQDRGKKAGTKAEQAPAAELPGLADLQRLLAAGRPARRSEHAVKGSNALVATVTFFAAALQEELAAGEAREAGLTERLAAAERALVAGGPGLVRPGPAHQRHRDALEKLLLRGPQEAPEVGHEAAEALRFVLGAA